jgi:glucosamine--fructose-6-phosphate aminotransferase (isomerizing)
MAGRTDLLAAMSSLPEIGSHLLRTCESASLRFGTDLNLDRFYFLGSGIRHGLACEANLKMKEMTLTHSEAFHFLEIRHGPMSMVGPSAVVVGLLSEKNHAQETAVLKDMQSLGAATFTLGESGTDLAFQSGLPEAIRGVLYLPALQLTAFHRSLAKGLNPDHPHNLTAVVHLSL